LDGDVDAGGDLRVELVGFLDSDALGHVTERHADLLSLDRASEAIAVVAARKTFGPG